MTASNQTGPPYQRGGFIQYDDNSSGTIINSVAFQFNPENLTRTIEIPPKPTGTAKREKNQVGDKPVEKITLTIQFSAADSLGANNPQSRQYGISPQLAILQKMATPVGNSGASQTKPVDKTGSKTNNDSKSQKSPTKPIPRNKYAKILFVWGDTRVLPVSIESLSIKEQQFDARLNPVQAEVSIGLAVFTDEVASQDKIASGAQAYTDMMEQTKTTEGQATTGQKTQDLISF